jgi:phosphatidylinositol 4-kinase
MENYAVGREKRRQLLLMLCQHEADRLEVWAQPTNTKYISFFTTGILLYIFSSSCADLLNTWYVRIFRENISRPKISSDKWVEHTRTAFAVDPRIALSVASRFPTNTFVKTEVTQLVQVFFFSNKIVSRPSQMSIWIIEIDLPFIKPKFKCVEQQLFPMFI